MYGGVMKNDVTGCSEIKPEPVDDDLEEFFYHLISKNA